MNTRQRIGLVLLILALTSPLPGATGIVITSLGLMIGTILFTWPLKGE